VRGDAWIGFESVRLSLLRGGFLGQERHQQESVGPLYRPSVTALRTLERDGSHVLVDDGDGLAPTSDTRQIDWNRHGSCHEVTWRHLKASVRRFSISVVQATR